jgi:GNAT superfamily N-acetyltransferase
MLVSRAGAGHIRSMLLDDMPHVHVRRGEYTITTDPAAVDHDAVYAAIVTSYWAESIPPDLLRRAIEGSLPFSLFAGDRQIGFARVITDCATFGYLADVYVLEEFRGRGLGRWLLDTVMAHPELQGLRRFMLVTRDAHGLYERVGFRALAAPERHMEIVRPGLYAAWKEATS